MHITTHERPDSPNTPALQENSAQGHLAIHSRFGTLNITPRASINFEHGILGIAGNINFCLTEVPDSNKGEFKLLQSVEDESLCFIVIPTDAHNDIIAKEDIHDACQTLSIDEKHLLLLFLVSAHETKEGKRLSINAKAPLVIDVQSKTGTQYVFQNPDYEIRQMIS